MANKNKYVDEDLQKDMLNFLNKNTKSSSKSNKISSSDDYSDLFSTFESSYSKVEKDFAKAEETRKQNEIEAKKQAEEKAKYYETNKQTLIKDRTNSLIYSWNLDDSGGVYYNYNDSIDTKRNPNNITLGIDSLNLNNFLVDNELAKYKNKAEEWNEKENNKNIINSNFKSITDRYNKYISPTGEEYWVDIYEDLLYDKNKKLINDDRLRDKEFIESLQPTNEFSLSMNSLPTLDNKSKINPYENKDSYYKKYIEKFNESLAKNDIKGMNNALEKINSKYFGADYDDGMIASVLNAITDSGDYNTLETRFNTNVKKLEAINSSIENGTDNDTLAKLQQEKSKLEFENQLIQYNRIVSIHSNNKSLDTINAINRNIEEPFKNIDYTPLEWNNNKNVVENITDNFASLLNTTVQTISATSNAIMEGSFSSINALLTDDMNDTWRKDLASGILDFGEYLIPGIGQAKLYLDTASEAGVLLPGIYDNTIVKGINALDGDLKEQTSAKLGNEAPTLRQTFWSSVYIAMNAVLDKILSKGQSPQTRETLSKMTGKEVFKYMIGNGTEEAIEEFVQAFAEAGVYDDGKVFTKENFLQACKNGLYAFLIGNTVSGVQAGSSKIKYKNNITSDTVYTQVSSPKENINNTSSTVSEVNVNAIKENIDKALQDNKAISIINKNINTDSTENNISINNTETATEIENKKTTKIDYKAIEFDSADKTILNDLKTNVVYLESQGLGTSPTLKEVYDLLASKGDSSLNDKLFYYVKEYGDTKFKKFVDNIDNINVEEIANKVLPKNNNIDFNPGNINNNTTDIIVPSQEMANYIESNNPSATTTVLDPKSPTYKADLQDYVATKARSNIKYENTTKQFVSENKITPSDITNMENIITGFRKSLTTDNTEIKNFKINTSDLVTGDMRTINSSVLKSFINDSDLSALYSKEELRKKYKDLSSILNSYIKDAKASRKNIKTSSGNTVYFEKTGLNTYKTSNDLDVNELTTPVKTNGLVIDGNSTRKLDLSKQAINTVNDMITTLGLNGDYLNLESTGKDVQKLISQNKDMSGEILQALGYDGITYGKDSLKYISALDNMDNINLEKVATKVDNEIKNETKTMATSKEEFMARLQIAKDMLQNKTNTKPESVGEKIRSTKNTKVKTNLSESKMSVSEANRVSETITESNLDSSGGDTVLAFNNSKVKNEDGSLKTVYRGSNASKILSNSNIDTEKISFFTDNKDIANSYRNSKDGKQYSGNINIENPYVVDGKGNFFNKISNELGSTTDEIVANIIKSNKANKTNYDGIIFENVIDRGPYYHGKIEAKTSTVYVTLNSNQINILDVDVNNKTKIANESTVNTPINNISDIKVGDIEIKDADTEMYSTDVLKALDEINIKDKKANKKMKDSLSYLYTAIVDRFHPIQKIADSSSDVEVKNAVSNSYTLGNKVYNNINVAQTDINNKPIGKSIKEIKSEIRKGDETHFQNYMRLLLNAERIENDMEPLLNLDAKKSRLAASNIEKQLPYFKNITKDIKNYNINSNAKLQEAGVISIEQEAAANNKYQYYFPVYSSEAEDFVDIGTKEYNNRFKVNDTMLQTTKKGKNVLDIWTAMSIKEYNINSAILNNEIAKTMANSTKGNYKGTTGKIIYYEDGKPMRLDTTEEIAASLSKRTFEKQMDKIFSLPGLRLLPNIQELERKMLTSYDPIYQLNNLQRDLADSALIHSKYKTKFLQNYARAINNVANNSVYYQQIVQSGIIPMNNGKNKFTRVLKSIESLPKIAEYMSAKQSGKSDIEAKLDAQDVNLNFARGGYVTQSLNKHGWLFLNASVQGADKVYSTGKRLIQGAKTPKGALELVLTIGAAAAPGIINALINDDDDDYDKLPYYYKNNYYFIKLDNNKFLRLPKGRVVGFVDTLVRYALGISNENTAEEYITALKDTAQSSVLPNDVTESTPWSLITNILDNENYFGSEIYNENDTITNKTKKSAMYILENMLGKYGKLVKYSLDGDSTTDVWTIQGYVFDSTKYDRNISTVYDLQEKYQYKNKTSELTLEDKIIKKYIDTKLAAINGVSAEINSMKKNGATIQEMSDLYQERDALTKDTIDNYKSYEITKEEDYYIINFDDLSYKYYKKKKKDGSEEWTFKKLD